MACHLPVTRPTWNHLWNSEYFEIYEITYKWRVPSEIIFEIQNISESFHLQNIEFKIHTFLFTFEFILIK